MTNPNDQYTDLWQANDDTFRSLVQSLTDVAVFLLDPQGHVVSWNPGAEAIKGYKTHEILGKHHSVFYPNEDLLNGRPQTGLATAIRDARWKDEGWRVKKDGTKFWAEVVITALKSADDEIRGFAKVTRDLTERKRMEDQLRYSEAKFSGIVSIAADAIISIDDQHRIVLFNEGAEAIFGYRASEVIGQPLHILLPENLRAAHTQHIQNFEQSSVSARRMGDRAEIFGLRKDGENFPAEASISKLILGAEKIFTAVLRDISARKRAEEELRIVEDQLRQSQRMDAVGQLAGGVAHDFNNLITVINGYCDLALLKLSSGDPLQKTFEAIKKAGIRAAELTRQLLAFSRNQILQPQVLDINQAIGDISEIVHRSIGEHIQISLSLADNIGKVFADRGQIEQVILNLVVNARDALDEGGTLIIETANVFLDGAYAKLHHGVISGPYVMLAISDTGKGMDNETQKHIFEPFFTTKPVGKGTGLGLATVYGIVKQSGGHIWVYSEVGKGTTFKIYLPRVEGDVTPTETNDDSTAVVGGSETILLVEDDDMVRNLALAALRWHGYKILAAEHGDQAIAICRQITEPIHLLLTDVVMPGMNGAQVADKITALRPDVGVLFMSGYTANVIAHHGVLDEGTELIEKPFTPEQLARKVREVLDKQKSQ